MFCQVFMFSGCWSAKFTGRTVGDVPTVSRFDDLYSCEQFSFGIVTGIQYALSAQPIHEVPAALSST